MNTARNWPPEADPIATDGNGYPLHRVEFSRWRVTVVRTMGAVEYVDDVWASSREAAQGHVVACYEQRGAPIVYTSAVPSLTPMQDAHDMTDDDLDSLGREADRRALMTLLNIGGALIALIVLFMFGQDIADAVFGSLP